jgi:hypothetical protein
VLFRSEIPAAPDLATSAQDVSLRPAMATRSGLVVYYNGGTAPVTTQCPARTNCTQYQAVYVGGVTGSRVSWPIVIAPKQAAVVLFAADEDEDGVLDQDDYCPDTAAKASTDELGCSFLQSR